MGILGVFILFPSFIAGAERFFIEYMKSPSRHEVVVVQGLSH